MVNNYTIIFLKLYPNRTAHSFAYKLARGSLRLNQSLAYVALCGLVPTKLSSPGIPSASPQIPAILVDSPFPWIPHALPHLCDFAPKRGRKCSSLS